MDFKFTIIIFYYFRVFNHIEIVSCEQNIDLGQKWVDSDSIVNEHSNTILWLQKVTE